MVHVIEPDAGSPIDLDMLWEQLELLPYQEAEPFSEGFTQAAAHLLQRFSKNRYAIREHIDRCGGIDMARKTFVPPQTFLVGSSARFSVRINVWPPIKNSEFVSQESALYAYGLAHNHDFNFLTIGYYGGGYTTDLYQIAPEETLLPPGSTVNLKNYRCERLSEGRVIAFSAFEDLHTQYPPEELSISINLIPKRNPVGYDQAIFDTDVSKLVERVNTAAGRIATTIDVATAYPAERTYELIAEVGRTTDRQRVRDMANAKLAAVGIDPLAQVG